MHIVPVTCFTEEEPGTISETRMVPPHQCYLKQSTDEALYSKIFVLVDFGIKANSFLQVCGTKSRPSAEDIVQALLSDSGRHYKSLGKDK